MTGALSLPDAHEPTGFADSGVPSVVLDDPQQLVGHTILGRFKVEGVLGMGGMGAVLRCLHLGLQRDIAVKVLHPQFTSHPEISARFAREAQTMSRLSHPNCVRVLDFGVFDTGGSKMQYLAMELLSGCELSELMLRPLPPERAMSLMDQVLAGLEHAHAAGIVHRDLKPENVFVTTDHEGNELLKIVDFGIAKIVAGQGAGENMTVAGTIFGTPRYMSPEQCAGGAVDERTDVYAAGIMLYEMLAGHVPFDDKEDPMQVIHKHILEPVPDLPTTVPRPLVELVNAMLAKEKAHRLPSIEEARERMNAVRQGLANGTAMSVASATLLPSASGGSMSAVSVPAMAVVKRPTQNRRPWMIAAGASFAAFVVALGIALSGDDEAEGEPEREVPEAVAKALAPEPTDPKDAVAAVTAPMAAVLAPKASDEQLDKLDAMLADQAFKKAAAGIRRLLDDFPKDAQLHLRLGRALRADKPVKALASYARALELDPTLLSDEALRAELTGLMRHPEVRGQALDLAIRQLGKHGVPYLLERVNDAAAPAPIIDRHRALEALTALDSDSEVMEELNVALDLWQAEESRDPCAVYGNALDEIEAEPSSYYLGSVWRSTPPPDCAGLTERRDAVGDKLMGMYPVKESEWVVPEAYAKKRRKRGGRGRGGILRRLGFR